MNRRSKRASVRSDLINKLLPVELLSKIFSLRLTTSLYNHTTDWVNLRLVSCYWKVIVDHLPEWKNGSRFLNFSRHMPISIEDEIFMRILTCQAPGFSGFHVYMWHRLMIPSLSNTFKVPLLDVKTKKNHIFLFVEEENLVKKTNRYYSGILAFYTTRYGLVQVPNSHVEATYDVDKFLCTAPHKRPNSLDLLVLLDDKKTNSCIAIKFSGKRYGENLKFIQIKSRQHFYPQEEEIDDRELNTSSKTENNREEKEKDHASESLELPFDTLTVPFSIILLTSEQGAFDVSPRMYIFANEDISERRKEVAWIFIKTLPRVPACMSKTDWQRSISSNLGHALSVRFLKNWPQLETSTWGIKKRLTIFYILFDEDGKKLLTAQSISFVKAHSDAEVNVSTSPVFCCHYVILDPSKCLVYEDDSNSQKQAQIMQTNRRHFELINSPFTFNLFTTIDHIIRNMKNLSLEIELAINQRNFIFHVQIPTKSKRHKRRAKQIDICIERTIKRMEKCEQELEKLKAKLFQNINEAD